jgi:Gpi18-like mannosyltransferase
MSTRNSSIENLDNSTKPYSDWWIVAQVFIIKVIILGFGAEAFQIINNEKFEGWYDFIGIWNRWDSLAYQDIAANGYSMIGENRFRLVFFPLYPLISRAFAYICGDYLIAAFIVSTIALLGTALVFKRLVELDYSVETVQRSILFLLIFPTSYFLHISYTESLFLALSIGSVWAARTERWWLAGLLGALSTLTRINGLILIPTLFIESILQRKRPPHIYWKWASVAAVTIGFGLYLLVNRVVSGDWLTFLALQQENWSKSLSWPWLGIYGTFYSLWRAPSEAHMVGMQELIFVILGFICTLWAWIKLRPTYAMWMTGNWILFTSTSFILSVPRYTLVMFPLFIIFAELAKNQIWKAAITLWSLLYMALFIMLFVRGHWAF